MPDADAPQDPPLPEQVARYLAARHPDPQPPGYLAADLGVAVLEVVQALAELASAGRARPGPVVDGVQLWAPSGPDLRHAEAHASAEAAVARFNALSDAAGNPGAPGPTCPARYCLTGSHTHTCTRPYAHPDRGHHCACGDGWSANPDELPHPFRQAAVDDTECEVCGRDVADLLHTPTPGPGARLVGINDVAAMAGPGQPLSHALNHLAATLTDIQTRLDSIDARVSEDLGAVLARLPLNPTPDWLPHAVARPRVPGMDDPVDHHPGLHTTRARFDQVDAQLAEIRALLAGRTVVHAAPTQAQAQARYDRTLSAMDRVTQVDAEQVIHRVLMTRGHEETRAAELAEAIAEALYGPTTEAEPWTCPECGQATLRTDVAPTEGDGRRPLDLRGHACTRPVGPPGPPYGEPPACGQPATEVDSIGRPRCPEHLAQAQNATSIDTEGDG